MIGVVALILVAGSNNDDEDEEVAADVNTTPTVVDDVETPELTPEIELSPTPEAVDDDDESMPTPEPTPRETPEATPEPAEPTPAPSPTPPPLVGDFGELPASDMPSGSPAEALNLEFHLDMSLQAIPAQAPVYQIERRQWTIEDAANLASRLGIQGDVADQGDSYRVEDEAASVYISSSMIQYIRPFTTEEIPDLPENEQLAQMARAWLTDTGIVGADIGPAQVLDRDPDSGRAFILVKPVQPPDIISATPSASVTIRGDGVVTEAMVNWPRALHASTYGLRSPEDLWGDASRGRHFVDIDVNQLPAGFSGASGTVTITSSSLAYTISGSPQATQFLVPVVVFSGTANIQGADGPIPVRIYVEAVSAQASPRG
jgi:hypothetical protein